MHPIARHLATDFRVHAPDLPGFGRSGKPERIPSIAELADALAAWTAAAGLSRASLLSNPLGCEILAGLALRHPEQVERLVLQGPTPEPGHARTASYSAATPLQASSNGRRLAYLRVGLRALWSAAAGRDLLRDARWVDIG